MEENVVDNNQETKNNKTNHHFLKIILIIFIVLLLLVIIASTTYYIFLLKRKEEIINYNTQAIIKEEKIIEYGTSLTYGEILENVVDTTKLEKGTIIKIWMNDTLLKQEQYTFDKIENIKIKIDISTPILPTLKEEFIGSLSEILNPEVHTTEEIIWNIKDTKMPVISGVQDKEITQGDEIDIKAGITATDEIDGELEVTIEGEFDANKVGEYTLTAKAVDKNQNEIVQTFKIIVKEKPKTSTKPNISNNANSSNNTNNSNSSNSSNNSNNSSSSNKTGGSSSSGSSGASNTPSASTKDGRLALAKAEAKRVVGQIIKPGMSNLQKATAICNYITTTVDVQHDQSSEAYKTNYGNEAYAALIMKIAACSGRCKAVTLLCDAAGLKSQHINQNQWTHQWNKIQMEDGSWVIVDAQIGLVEKE